MSAPGTTLVTGASGFVGRHLCRDLAADGVRVRALVRAPSAPPHPGVETAAVSGLDDVEALKRALEGVDTVVRLAARVHVMKDASADPLAEFRRVNVEGTRTLLREAVRAGAARFVLASSVKAMGEGGERVFTEADPAAPADPYGVSKREAEEVVRGIADAAGMHAPVLRLPLVYGPGMKGNMLSLFRLVERGVPLPLGAVRNRRSMVYVGNLTAAVRAVLAAPGAARETFLVSDGADLSTPGLVREIARALGRPARLVPVPPALFRLAGRTGDVLSRAVPFPLTSAAVHRLLGSYAVDPSRLAAVTGFRPPFTVAEGMRATAEWYRGRGAGA